MKRLLYFLLFLFASNILVLGQVSVQARIDSSMLLIGDQTKILFEVTQDKNINVQFPILSDSIVKGVEIVSVLKPDTIELDNDQLQINADVIVTSFDSALYYIPSFKFIAGNDTIESNPLSLKVYSMPVDTAKGIYDIKPIYNARINWKQVLLIVCIILLVLALVTYLYFYIKKRYFSKPTVEEEKLIPAIPPHVKALKELDRIKKQKIWQQDRLKEFYTDVTTVLREYIENKYRIPALEMTSHEIISSINILQKADGNVSNAIIQVLMLADLVKFAKWVPTTLEHETTLNNAYLFVHETKQEILKEELEEPLDSKEEGDIILEDHDIS
jgi:hypothetical protein